MGKKKNGGGADWEKDIPEWLSPKTYRIAAALKVAADQVGVDIGTPMRAQRNGDAMWYVLTNGSQEYLKDHKGRERTVQHISILLCTPHCILIEDNFRAQDVTFSILFDPDEYLDHLLNSGARCLTDDELKGFLEGTL